MTDNHRVDQRFVAVGVLQMTIHRALSLAVAVLLFAAAMARGQYVDHAASPGAFAVVEASHAATIYVDDADFPG